MEVPVSVEVQGEKRFEPAPARRGLPWTTLLSVVVGLIGVSAIGVSTYVYGETRRDIARISTDIAQLRLSLELFGRQQGTPSATDSASLTDLANRLAILEGSWRTAPAETASPQASAAPTTAPAASDGDCLPTGTRFLVMAGDTYPICGITGTVEIGAVDNGFLSLGDGTVIAAGGNIGLPGTACMIGVVTAGQDGMSEFAEIRVTC